MMEPEGIEVLKKAKGYALRLLKLRPRSSLEISRKMAQKGYDQAVTAGVVADLTRAGFLDDRAFAKAWLQYRLQRPMGYRRIERELGDKGIPRDMVRAEWAEVRDDYDEIEVVRALAVKRARQYNNIDPLKRRKRVMDYLARRGFQLDVIMKVIKEI